jgi:cell pole-organizing protein PopZ
VHAAFNELERAVANNSRTLDDLVREMLRPILKVWLDDNLPGMVERLVRSEIERISSPRD